LRCPLHFSRKLVSCCTTHGGTRQMLLNFSDLKSAISNPPQHLGPAICFARIPPETPTLRAPTGCLYISPGQRPGKPSHAGVTGLHFHACGDVLHGNFCGALRFRPFPSNRAFSCGSSRGIQNLKKLASKHNVYRSFGSFARCIRSRRVENLFASVVRLKRITLGVCDFLSLHPGRATLNRGHSAPRIGV
jgi:hypothetical protein